MEIYKHYNIRANNILKLLIKKERMNELEETNENVEELENEEIENINEEENNIEVDVPDDSKKDNTALELEETTDRLKRIMAEFENYKKRETKEKDMLYKSISSDIVTSLLPAIDNLEHAANAKTEDEGYKQGVELVLKQFLDVLKTFGVEEIKTVGETFDPEVHEAVSSVQDENLGEKEIKEEFRKGYTIRYESYKACYG